MPLRSRIVAVALAAFPLCIAIALGQPSRPNAPMLLDQVDDAFEHSADAQLPRALDALGRLDDHEHAWSPAQRLHQIELLSRLALRSSLEAEILSYIELHRSSPSAAFAWIRRGLDALKRAHFGQARLYFDEAVREATSEDSPGDEDAAGTASYWLGIAHLVDPDGAMREPAILALSVAAHLYPRSRYADDALLAMGQFHESNGALDTAFAMYSELLERYPSSETHLDAAIRAAQTLLRLDRTRAAMAMLDGIGTEIYRVRQLVDVDHARLSQQEIEYHLLRAEASASMRDYPAAEQSYLTVIYQPETPFQRIAQLGLADTYRSAAKLDSAVAIYTRIVEADVSDYPGMHAQFQLALFSLVPPYHIAERTPMRTIAGDSSHLLRDQARLALAKVHYLVQELDSVEQLLETIPSGEVHPVPRAQAYLLRGVTRLAARRYAAAADDLAEASRIAEGIPTALMSERDRFLQYSTLFAGIAQVHCDRASDAVAQLTRIVLESADAFAAAEAAYWLGEAYYESGLLPAAVQAMEDLIERHPSSTRIEDALFTIGWAQYRQKKFESAEAAFARLVKAYPMTRYTASANLRRGDCLYLMKRYADAVMAYGAIDTAASNRQIVEHARYQAALASYHAEDLDDAVARFTSFEQAFQSSTLADDAAFMAGLILYRKKAHQLAIDRLGGFADAYPKSTLLPRALTTLAGAHLSLGNLDSAYSIASIVVNNHATSFYAADARVGMERAEAARRERARQEARATEQRREQEIANADRASLAAGYKALALGDTTAAVDSLVGLTRRAPERSISIAAFDQLATVAIAQRANERARLYLRSVADMSDSAAPWALYRIADLFFADSAWTDAIATLKLLMEKNRAERSLNARAALRLGAAYEASGDHQHARETYRALVGGGAGEEISRMAEERLRKLEEL